MSPQNARNGISEYYFPVEYARPIYNCDHVYIKCDNASLKHFAGSSLSSLSRTTKHPQTSCPKFTGTGRQRRKAC